MQGDPSGSGEGARPPKVHVGKVNLGGGNGRVRSQDRRLGGRAFNKGAFQGRRQINPSARTTELDYSTLEFPR